MWFYEPIPDSCLVIGAGVVLGEGCVIQAYGGSLVIEEGVTLGRQVLLIGQGIIHKNACIGALSTLMSTINVMENAMIPAQSLVGAPEPQVQVHEVNHHEVNHHEMNHHEVNHHEVNHHEVNHREVNHHEVNHHVETPVVEKDVPDSQRSRTSRPDSTQINLHLRRLAAIQLSLHRQPFRIQTATECLGLSIPLDIMLEPWIR